jgi:hypothetical protein
MNLCLCRVSKRHPSRQLARLAFRWWCLFLHLVLKQPMDWLAFGGWLVGLGWFCRLVIRRWVDRYSTRPVLKHGPRSLTYMQAEQSWIGLVGALKEIGMMCYHYPSCNRLGWYTAIPARDMSSLPRLSRSFSIYVSTRKMVNYARARWSQRKLWWRSVAILTCKSIVRSGYRGERLIEPSSSWFLPKFPSG